jgi:Rieske 2Fe-2S family protein
MRASRFTTDDLDPREFSLFPIAAEEWNGWIFLNMDCEADPLADWLGNLSDHLANWEPERLASGATHEYVVKANWKLILENFVECYHCPSIHPELCAVSDPEGVGEKFRPTGRWLGAPLGLLDHAETQSLDGRGGVPFRNITETQAREVQYYLVFPNLLISPHPDYVMTHRLLPLSPTETFVECSWMFPPEAVLAPDFDPSFASDFWDRTNNQDFGACESVMRGMHSPGYRPGPFDRREVTVHTVQVMLARAYETGRLPLAAPMPTA